MIRSNATKTLLEADIMSAAHDLASAAYRMSTEDCFDLLCDLSDRHGRDIKKLGPPCACEFAHYLPCLSGLVTSLKDDPHPLSHVKDRDKDASSILNWFECMVEDDCIDDDCLCSDHTSWRDDLNDAWDHMIRVLWQTADGVETSKLPGVVEARKFLTDANGLDLYYTILARETKRWAGPTGNTKRSGYSDSKSNFFHLDRDSLKSYVERIKKEHQSNLTAQKALEEFDPLRNQFRMQIAGDCREQGNMVYGKKNWSGAAQLYTRAIGYDNSKPVFPLNRAACYLKLKRFAEAERDCTTALSLSPSNHKAYFRRGVSRAAQGKHSAAKADFEQVLILQKDDPAALEELKKLGEKHLQGSVELKSPGSKNGASSPTSSVATKKSAGSSASTNSPKQPLSAPAPAPVFQSKKSKKKAAKAAKAAAQAAQTQGPKTPEPKQEDTTPVKEEVPSLTKQQKSSSPAVLDPKADLKEKAQILNEEVSRRHRTDDQVPELKDHIFEMKRKAVEAKEAAIRFKQHPTTKGGRPDPKGQREADSIIKTATTVIEEADRIAEKFNLESAQAIDTPEEHAKVVETVGTGSLTLQAGSVCYESNSIPSSSRDHLNSPLHSPRILAKSLAGNEDGYSSITIAPKSSGLQDVVCNDVGHFKATNEAGKPLTITLQGVATPDCLKAAEQAKAEEAASQMAFVYHFIRLVEERNGIKLLAQKGEESIKSGLQKTK